MTNVTYYFELLAKCVIIHIGKVVTLSNEIASLKEKVWTVSPISVVLYHAKELLYVFFCYLVTIYVLKASCKFCDPISSKTAASLTETLHAD